MKSILLLDDEVSIRDSLSRYLEEFDFEVTMAVSAEEALEIMDHREFDLGVIDIRLPGMNGDAFIVLAHRQHPKMRFLIHTGSAEYGISGTLRLIGLRESDVLQKPLADLGILRQAIDRLLPGDDCNEQP
ncbi:MAG: response regulator [Deltaproteobacteria bacterium]|nr:response regulator [Deltaproteobacteria bacterium]